MEPVDMLGAVSFPFPGNWDNTVLLPYVRDLDGSTDFDFDEKMVGLTGEKIWRMSDLIASREGGGIPHSGGDRSGDQAV